MDDSGSARGMEDSRWASGMDSGASASGREGRQPSLTAEGASRLERCLAGDGVALIPTDTVYGLACSPDSARALRRIYELKRRPPQKPAAVMFFSLKAALATLTELGPRGRAAVEALLPGPVTLLLENPRSRYLRACAPGGSGVGLLGLRVPALAGSLASLAAVGVPAAQSSANFAGEADPRALSEVPAQLREGVDLVIDGGDLPGAASTVVDLSTYEESGSWRVVREGPVGTVSLARVLGPNLVERPRSCADEDWFVEIDSESTDSIEPPC